MTEKEIIEAIQKIENEQERRKKLPINNYNTGEKEASQTNRVSQVP